MSVKEEAIELIRRLPDDVTAQRIIDELYFMAQVERGLSDVEAGRVLDHSELQQRIGAWRRSVGP